MKHAIAPALFVALTFVLGCSQLPETTRQLQQGVDVVGTCDGLTEQVCLTTLGCELVYPACPMCMPDSNCPPCDDAPTCREAPKRKDPAACEQLEEQGCLARSDCIADYGACTKECRPDGQGGGEPCPSTYFACHTAPVYDPCIGLSERACNQASGCIGMYSGQCPPCPKGAACAPCDDSNFAFSDCAPDRTWCEGTDGGYEEPRDGGGWGWPEDGGYEEPRDGGGWGWPEDGGSWGEDKDGGSWGGGGWDKDAGRGG